MSVLIEIKTANTTNNPYRWFKLFYDKTRKRLKLVRQDNHTEGVGR